MTVNFSTANSKIGYVPTVTVSNAVAQNTPTKDVIKADTLEVSEKEQKGEKKNLVQKVSGGIGSIKKFFASLGEYTKGVFKGLAGGAVAGSLVYTASSALKALKKKPKTKGSAILAGLVAAGTFVYNIYKAYLNTNDAKAQIDHRYR